MSSTSFASVVVAVATTCLATLGDREPVAILRDFDAVSYPSFSDGSDPESIARFTKTIDEAAKRQEELALELLAAAPAHPRLAEVMERRWALLVNVGGETARVLEESEPFVAREAPAASRSTELRRVAFAARAHAAVEARDLEFARRRELVEAALAANPTDELAAESLLQLVTRCSADPALQREALARLVRDFGTSEALGRELTRFQRLLERIGTKVDFGRGDVARAIDESASSGGTRRPCVVASFPSPDATLEAQETAAAKQLHERFAARGLELVLVHALFDGDTEEERRARIAKLGLPGRAAFERWSPDDPGVATRVFDVNASPFAALIDAEGRLVAVSFRLESLAPQVEALLGRASARPRKRAI
jgi:hypothetical protein